MFKKIGVNYFNLNFKVIFKTFLYVFPTSWICRHFSKLLMIAIQAKYLWVRGSRFRSIGRLLLNAACIYIYMCTYIYVYAISVYIHLYMCVFIFIYASSTCFSLCQRKLLHDVWLREGKAEVQPLLGRLEWVVWLTKCQRDCFFCSSRCTCLLLHAGDFLAVDVCLR